MSFPFECQKCHHKWNSSRRNGPKKCPGEGCGSESWRFMSTDGSASDASVPIEEDKQSTDKRPLLSSPRREANPDKRRAQPKADVANVSVNLLINQTFPASSTASLGHGELLHSEQDFRIAKQPSKAKWWVLCAALVFGGIAAYSYNGDQSPSQTAANDQPTPVLRQQAESPPAAATVQKTDRADERHGTENREAIQPAVAAVEAPPREAKDDPADNQEVRPLGTIDDVRELWRQHPEDIEHALGPGRISFTARVFYRAGQRVLNMPGHPAISCVIAQNWVPSAMIAFHPVDISGRYFSHTNSSLILNDCRLEPQEEDE